MPSIYKNNFKLLRENILPFYLSFKVVENENSPDILAMAPNEISIKYFE